MAVTATFKRNASQIVKAVCAALILSLTACVAPPPPPMFGNPGSHTIPNGPVAEYRLSPGDEIDITFVNTPEFNSHQIIRADGAEAWPTMGKDAVGARLAEAIAAHFHPPAP